LNPSQRFRILSASGQYADAPHLPGLLRARHDWPCRRATALPPKII
jgi:hypothetical protein